MQDALGGPGVGWLGGLVGAGLLCALAGPWLVLVGLFCCYWADGTSVAGGACGACGASSGRTRPSATHRPALA